MILPSIYGYFVDICRFLTNRNKIFGVGLHYIIVKSGIYANIMYKLNAKGESAN